MDVDCGCVTTEAFFHWLRVAYEAGNELLPSIKPAPELDSVAKNAKLLPSKYPVIPDEVLSAIRKVARIRTDLDHFDGDRRGIADCLDEAEQELIVTINEHAAMLQGAEPVTTAYKLPANTPCKEAPEHIWLQTAGLWPENGEFSELTWCSDNQHPDDTLYVRADVVTGNSPVIPDGWVACSERMPKKGEEVLCTDKFENYETALYDTGYIPGPPFFATTAGEFHPTHWMPLPAAPQQEAE
nr:DUF551 domain-containing protein [Citrobacter amalonaticus]